MSRAPTELERRILAVVRRIPRGKVSTYGDVAALAGSPGAARAVGRVLSHLDGGAASRVPWQRVVNAAGKIPLRDPDAVEIHRDRLAAEGIRVGPGRPIDLARHGWPPRRKLDRLIEEDKALVHPEERPKAWTSSRRKGKP